MKYYVLLPTTDMVGGSIDTYQWTTLLRALSAYRAFHWSYGGEYRPRKIAHFLILNRACPRSLLHCQDKVGEHLGRLAKAYGSRTPAHDRLQAMLGELAEAQVEDIIEEGLHEFLTRFIHQNAALGAGRGRRLSVRGPVMRLTVRHAHALPVRRSRCAS